MSASCGSCRVFVYNTALHPDGAPVDNIWDLTRKEWKNKVISPAATGIGRGMALDRDGDYRKTKKAYDALAFGIGRKVPSGK